MELIDKKQEILNFTLPSSQSEDKQYTRVLLQLFGYAGHGKSAFVNSCFYTLGTEEYQMHANTGSSDNIITTDRKAYKLTDTITIVDNRGFGKMGKNEEAIAYAQLGHFLPLDEKVEWTEDFVQIMSQVEDSDRTPNYTDFLAPIFVYSMKIQMPKEQVEEVQKFFMNCRDMTGVFPIVVLTNKLKKCGNNLEEAFRNAGAEVVIAIENYTSEDHIKTRGRCADIQEVICNALKDVQFRLEQPRDPMEERLKRKKILLKFAYESVVEELKSKAKEHEYERLKALADKSWFKRFPYGK